jgi:hypothetical protein
MKTMEYDDRLPKELPVKGSPEISATGDDRLEKLRADYREAAATRFGVPRSNHRDGWIRVT